MHHQRWVYIVIILVGAALAIGIAGFPTTHHDAPLHLLTTTTTVAPAPTGTP